MHRTAFHALLVLLLLTASATAQRDPGRIDWPEELSECPPHVRLDRSRMEDHDGRKEKPLRFRPALNDRKKTEHSEFELSNLRIHHVSNEIALKVNSGSPDKPKVNGQVASYTKITFRNLDIGPAWRTTSGLHMDHLWFGPGHDDAFRPDVLFEDVFLHDSNPGVMPLLFEAGGKWGTVTIRRVAVVNTKHPFMIKLKNSSFREIVIEECPGLRVTMQGAGEPVTVRVRKSEGCVISTPKDNDGGEAKVTIVNE